MHKEHKGHKEIDHRPPNHENVTLTNHEARESGGGRSCSHGPTHSARSRFGDVLRAESGQAVRAGVLDMGRSDAATVRWVSSGKEPAMRLELGPSDALLRAAPESERPRVDLLLAMLRPLQFGRMLPMMSSLGIGTLWVTKAAKTEKAYFSSHLRAGKEAELRAALVEGLAQAGLWKESRSIEDLARAEEAILEATRRVARSEAFVMSVSRALRRGEERERRKKRRRRTV